MVTIPTGLENNELPHPMLILMPRLCIRMLAVSAPKLGHIDKRRV